MLNKPSVLSTGEWLLPAAVWERPAGESTPPPYRHDLGPLRGAHVVAVDLVNRSYQPIGGWREPR